MTETQSVNIKLPFCSKAPSRANKFITLSLSAVQWSNIDRALRAPIYVSLQAACLHALLCGKAFGFCTCMHYLVKQHTINDYALTRCFIAVVVQNQFSATELVAGCDIT